jgi:hypothetical protein
VAAASDVAAASRPCEPAGHMDEAVQHRRNRFAVVAVVDKASCRTCLSLLHHSQEHRMGWLGHRNHRTAPFGR